MTGNEALLTFALIAGGFLLGGVMFSRALPKLLTGKDVCALRADKNPGAANVFAVCGVPMGLLCLALDMLKAYLPVSLAAQYLDTQSVWFALALAAPVRSFCRQAAGQIREADYILVHHQKSDYVNAAKEMDALLSLRRTGLRSVQCRKGVYRT